MVKHPLIAFVCVCPCTPMYWVHMWNEAVIASWTSSVAFQSVYMALPIDVVDWHTCSDKVCCEYLPKNVKGDTILTVCFIVASIVGM